MSSYALNRNYNLQLPNSFVEIDKEEMEYVDGGVSVSKSWSGFQVTLSSGECADTAAVLAGGSVTAATISGVLGLTGVGIPYAIALAIGSGIMGLGSAYMWYCSNKNGFYFKYNFVGANNWGRIN